MKSTLRLLAFAIVLLCLTGMAWAEKAEVSDANDRISKLTVETINQINDANPWDYYAEEIPQFTVCSMNIIQYDSQ